MKEQNTQKARVGRIWAFSFCVPIPRGKGTARDHATHKPPRDPSGYPGPNAEGGKQNTALFMPSLR